MTRVRVGNTEKDACPAMANGVLLESSPTSPKCEACPRKPACEVPFTSPRLLQRCWRLQQYICICISVLDYEKNMRVWNMSCGCMRASTVGCRVLDRGVATVWVTV